MSTRGGKRAGAGRPKGIKEKGEYGVQTLICTAAKELYNKKTKRQAKIELLKKLLATERGRQWCAEHLFGKPVDHVKVDKVQEIKITYNEKPVALHKVS